MPFGLEVSAVGAHPKAHVPARLDSTNVPHHALCILRSTTLITHSIIPCVVMCLCTLHWCVFRRSTGFARFQRIVLITIFESEGGCLLPTVQALAPSIHRDYTVVILISKPFLSILRQLPIDSGNCHEASSLTDCNRPFCA